MSLESTSQGDLEGQIVFFGNLEDTVTIRLRKGGRQSFGDTLKEVSFRPVTSPNPYRLNGIFRGLTVGRMYTLVVESYRAGVLKQETFRLVSTL